MNYERAQYWLGVGAQPTDSVQHILEITGDWQRFKGLPGAEGTLQRAGSKPDRAELFNRALEQAGEAPVTEATTPRKKASRPAEASTEARSDNATTGADDREDTATVADGQV